MCFFLFKEKTVIKLSKTYILKKSQTIFKKKKKFCYSAKNTIFFVNFIQKTQKNIYNLDLKYTKKPLPINIESDIIK